MVKFNASVGNVEVRMLRIVQIALLIENLGDTLCTGHTHRHHNKYHGEHHEAHKDIHAIGKKAHQLAGCQAAANDHLGAQPADQKNTAVDGKLHQRCVIRNIFLCFTENVVDVSAGFLEFAGLMTFTHISFYHTDGRNVLLHAGIQIIVFREGLLEIFAGSAHNKEQAASQKDDSNKINAGQTGIDHESHGHGYDHAGRGTHTHTKKHLICVLQVRHVGGQTRHKTRRTEFVNV